MLLRAQLHQPNGSSSKSRQRQPQQRAKQRRGVAGTSSPPLAPRPVHPPPQQQQQQQRLARQPQPQLRPLQPPDPARPSTPPSAGAGARQQQQQPAQQPAQAQQQAQQASSMGTASKLVPGVRSSQDELVDYLVRSRLVKTQRVADALRGVDRGAYVNRAFASRADAYMDHPLAIGGGQTISAPHMHAICLELLEPHLQPGARVLDVGAGSGYLTACMAKLVQPGGSVLGVEKVPELVVHAQQALSAANPELLGPQAGGGDGAPPLLRVVHGNVLGEMLAGEAAFDVIHVGAAADELHQVLLDKLAPGGRMVIPVGPRYSYQVLMAVDKDASGSVRTEALMDVGYVPLTRPSELEDGQLF